MGNGNILARIIVILVIFGILLSVVFVVGAAYRRGLGPPLNPLPQEPTWTGVAPIGGIGTETPTSTPALVSPTPTIPGPCSETAAWNLMVLGVDTVALRGDRGSDLTRIVRLDFPNRTVTAYALSRELWVNASNLGLTGPTVNSTELGTVFYEAMRRSPRSLRRDAMVDGANAMAAVLAWNFSVRADHYIMLDVAQAPAMIDAIGGVPINIPQRTTDPWIGMVIQPGQQTLSGAQAVAYARARPDSDLGRIGRQQLLFDALLKRVLEPGVWSRLPQLYAQFSASIVTDLSPEQINHVSCLLNELPGGAIVQDGVRSTWTSPGPGGSLLWDSTSVLNHMRSLGLIQ
jgi:LCP family protein required for cell wall assembly